MLLHHIQRDIRHAPDASPAGRVDTGAACELTLIQGPVASNDARQPRRASITGGNFW